MANQTIYPYGRNGLIPSGYPIADDLNTDSAQQALSAKQGKVIGDFLFGHFEQDDLSQVTVSSFGLGAGDQASTRWTANGLHFVYPVTPGMTIKVTVASTENTGGFWAWFTDAYQVPSSTSDIVPYVLGTSRQWQNNGTQTRVVPAGAAYICFCPRDGTSKNSTWSLRTFIEAENEFVKEGSPELKAAIKETVDVSSITESQYTLSTSNWLLQSGTTGKHKVVPVTPGMKIRIRATGSTESGNYTGFLTSDYVPPTSSSAIPYVTGTGREWRMMSAGWITLTCPLGSAYLCLVTQNGAGNTTQWEVERYVEKPIREAFEEDAIVKGDVINNLEDGGTESPLSAEQGKVLNEKLSDGMPLGITKHAYNGALVKVGNTHHVATKKVATVTSQYFQGGACYGNYLFMFTENNTTCWIYNLATSTLLQTYTIPSADRGFVSNCHCNTVNFGTEKYDSNDPFPLIYVSTGYNDGTDSGVLVYRIVAETENDVTTYSLSLVQTLKIPGTTWTEFIVGGDGDCFIKQTKASHIYYRMKLPKLSDGDITFDFENALAVYKMTPEPSWYNGSRSQGIIYHNGKICSVSGVPQVDETSLFIVIDLATGIREVEIDLKNTLGLTSESEALFIWNGHFCVAFRQNTGIYALYFD